VASVFRPTYYLDERTGKRCKANTPGAVKRKSKTWWCRYYLPTGERKKVKLYTDRKASETRAAELERRGARLDAGFADPLDEHAKRPLAEHAEDFRRYLAAKGNTAEYVAKLAFRLTAVLDACRFVRTVDLQSSAVVEYLGTLRRDGKSVKTANDYLAAVKGFARWLWRDKRCIVDPLAGLSKLANAETDVRHGRRDLSPDELARLLDAARNSRRTVRCLSGIDRHFLYLTACATGFRVSELASMTPKSFDLDGNAPTATVQAACTKNRKLAVQPLPLDVAHALREYLDGKPAGAPLWPDNPTAPAETWRLHAAELMRCDLAEARAAWLESFQDARQRDEAERSAFLAYCDAAGRYADFHALRHSFITMVGKAGVSPREHQDLARHSTYALTSRYSHSRFYDLAAAVQGLPIPTAGRAPQALPATGTDGRAAAPRSAKKSGLNLGLQPAFSGDSERQAEPETAARGESENHGNHAENRTIAVVSEPTDDSVREYPQGDSNPCLSRERAMS
jgi:site-specific recombinase XerC